MLAQEGLTSYEARYYSLVAELQQVGANGTEPVVGEPAQVVERSFWSGFISSFLFIFSSEIGDKTFILVIVYSIKASAFWVWISSSLALVAMHVISTYIGAISQYILS